MTGRKKRKLKSIETINNDRRMTVKDGKETVEQRTLADLPTELLEFILSHLTLKDSIRSSVVSKRWYAAAVSVRKANHPPWLMYFPKAGNLYEFYDPAHCKTYFVDYPELFGSRVCYTKDGWLLLYRPRNHRVFFFQPFSRELIKLPKFELTFQIVAFSCPPTDATCVVFTVKHISPTVVVISTCCPGATEWTTVNHQNRLPFVSSVWNKIIFYNGIFYCLSLTGWLGVYNPVKLTWHVLVVPPPKCPDSFYARNWWKGKFLAEYEGGLLVIYTCGTANPIIFKLDVTKMFWQEMETLDGLTLFASFLSSHSRTDLTGTMRNSVYFPKVRFFGRRCISYSFDDHRYYPRKQFHDWGKQDPFGNIWIDPPQDPSTFFNESC
ncbi:F-box/kelch-repeat protein At1g57790-like [Tripterygium wilfordii]|uniref:F-box/kelch-repeat protein At1g57790-like n=1 Tax=Tripterygium wilfordii TaxID=458696 RepID=UPI0018F7F128|nr:F-box/kelch-repeat protein At1g57790-like [Tripterygium wilfordii]